MRFSILATLSFLIGSLPLSSIAAPIIPPPWKFEDLPKWDAGVRGGIPTVATQISISKEKLTKSDDPAGCIQDALDSIKIPGAVLLPEGTYELTQHLKMRSGTVLRGSQGTHLRFNLTLPDEIFPAGTPRSWLNQIRRSNGGRWSPSL